MPRLPNATDLSGSGLGPARSFTNIPVPDIEGATRSVARGIEQVGVSIENVRKDREEKFRKQERFDTKMGLLKAEEAYANAVKDLDPLDPQYVEKKRTVRRETFGPILSAVKDPENKMQFDLETEADFVELGIRAEQEHRTARGKKQALDLDTYVDGIRKRVRDKTYKGDPVADITQMVNDSTDIDEVTKQEILPKYLSALNGDQFESEFDTIVTGGVSVTPSVQNAVTKAVTSAGADAPSWLGDYLLRTAMIESRGGRMKVNPENPQVAGTWQVDDDTAPELGLSLEDRLDDEKAAVGVTKLAMRDYKMLKEVLGREPTPAELYLAHQQGIGGGPKLLANPDKKAADVVGKKAVEQNLPDNMRAEAGTITAGEFAGYIMAKFDGDSGGMVDPNDTLETLRLTESYQRMSADDQAAAEKDVLTRIEKQNKEAKNSADLNTAREAANAAAALVGSLADGYNWLDENIADPEVREKARTMFKAEFEANEKARGAQYDTALDQVYVNVTNAINRGDISGAFAAIPAGIKRKDLEDLQKRIADGPIQIDDPRDLERINDLKFSRDPEDQRAFSKLELNRFRLSDATREKLFKEQQSIAKEFEQTGSAPSLAEPSKMLSDRLIEIGIDTSSKVKGAALQANLKAERRIKTILDTNLRLASERAGRKLMPDEMQRVMDETFLEFSRKTLKDGWLEDYEAIEQQGLPAIMAEFDSVEQRINAERQKINEPLIPAGSLLQQGIDELTRDYAEAKAIVDRDMRALMSRARSPQAQMQGDLDAEYNKLRRQQQYLETFRIDAEQLYNWLATKFAPKKEDE